MSTIACNAVRVAPARERMASVCSVADASIARAIRTDAGEVLTENAATLQYVADRFPDAALIPQAGLDRSRLQQWLCFIGTELHKAFYIPLLDPKAPDDAKKYSLEQGENRLAYLDSYLAGRIFCSTVSASPTPTCSPC